MGSVLAAARLSRPPVVASAKLGTPEEDAARAAANQRRLEALLGDFGAEVTWAFRRVVSPAEMSHQLRILAGKQPLRFDPFTMFTVDVPAAIAEKLVAYLARTSWVEAAYVAPRLAPVMPRQPTPAPAPAGEGVNQLHRGALGVAALEQGAVPGRNGEGQKLACVDMGWLPHTDLSFPAPTGLPSTDPAEAQHGTGTLGVISALPNGTGCIGLAPAATLCLVGWGDAPTTADLQGLLWEAYAALVGDPNDPAQVQAAKGSVILLEAQIHQWLGWRPGASTIENITNVPLDLDPALFAIVRTLTDGGFVVVEAAGNNAAVDLDTWTFSQTPDVTAPGAFTKLGDSGAILVSGCSSTADNKDRYTQGNTVQGKTRMDAYAWSENVYTCGTGNGYVYWGGTSSASAILAGVVVVLQGIRQGRNRERLTPAQVRSILKPGPGAPVVSKGIVKTTLGYMPLFGELLKHPLIKA